MKKSTREFVIIHIERTIEKTIEIKQQLYLSERKELNLKALIDENCKNN